MGRDKRRRRRHQGHPARIAEQKRRTEEAAARWSQPGNSADPTGAGRIGRKEETAGAVFAAMELVKGMLSDDEDEEPDEHLVDHLMNEVPRHELHQGFATLIFSFLQIIPEPTDIIAPLLRRLRRHNLVPEHELPTGAGALAAAALGQSPSRWRTRLGSDVKPTEALAWAYTAWLLADFIDHTRGKGTVAALCDGLYQNLEDSPGIEDDQDER